MRFAVALIILIFARPLAAEGAGADYCRPYARALTDGLIKFIWNRAYTSCLNAEEDPGPQLPADWRAALDVVDPAATPIPPAPPPRPASAPIAAAATPDLAKCRRNFPASFDARTATVIRPGNHHRRTPCP